MIVRNIPLKVVQGEELAAEPSAFWAYSRPGVPFTVNVPLGVGLTATEVANGSQLVLPGFGEAIDRSRIKIFVLVSGVNFETGAQFTSGREYDLQSDLQLGHYGEVDVEYGRDPKLWRGWKQFEEAGELFIFGYASLVSPSSVRETLGHEVDPAQFAYAKLAGWERSWSVGSDKSSHPERTFRKNDGSEFSGVTVVMGIVSRDGVECDGAVFPVTRGDLSTLDVRERNYSRRNVSESVTWAGKPDGCIVYTYVPTDEAEGRVRAAEKLGCELNIRAAYLDLIRRAFNDAGYRGTRPEFESVPYPVVEMTSEIDKSVQAVKQASLASSYFQSSQASGLIAGPASKEVEEKFVDKSVKLSEESPINDAQ